VPRKSSLLPDSYNELLSDLKGHIRSAQIKAALAVNRELILLYWQIGREILARQQNEGWGSKVIQRLARDLKQEFPDIKGFSRTNLLYMRAFAKAYPDETIVQRYAGQIPWRHNQMLLDKLKTLDERLWYAQKSLENNWSRDVLVMQIESNLFQRQGSAITNFEQTLPKPQSDLAQQMIKDPYHLDFLALTDAAQERELEQALVTHIRDFLLELGVGFAFVGNQYPIMVDEKEYRIDLLFYHYVLRCFVVIDLKMREFEPEYAGKMNFYVSAVDELMRHPDDQPTIGIILCRAKGKTTVEFALRNVNTPIGVSTHHLPAQLQENLPSVEQLEVELETVVSHLEAQSVDEISGEPQD